MSNLTPAQARILADEFDAQSEFDNATYALEEAKARGMPQSKHLVAFRDALEALMELAKQEDEE